MSQTSGRSRARGALIVGVVLVLILIALLWLRGCGADDTSDTGEPGEIGFVDRKQAFAIAKEHAIAEGDSLENARYSILSEKHDDPDLWRFVITSGGKERHVWVSRSTGEIVRSGFGR